jgi:hypothetical protein
MTEGELTERELAWPSRIGTMSIFCTRHSLEHFRYQMPIIPTSFHELRRILSKLYEEPKVHTAWLKPDTEYEDAYVSFTH